MLDESSGSSETRHIPNQLSLRPNASAECTHHGHHVRLSRSVSRQFARWRPATRCTRLRQRPRPRDSLSRVRPASVFSLSRRRCLRCPAVPPCCFHRVTPPRHRHAPASSNNRRQNTVQAPPFIPRRPSHTAFHPLFSTMTILPSLATPLFVYSLWRVITSFPGAFPLRLVTRQPTFTVDPVSLISSTSLLSFFA